LSCTLERIVEQVFIKMLLVEAVFGSNNNDFDAVLID
jgi:hypothetical protein